MDDGDRYRRGCQAGFAGGTSRADALYADDAAPVLCQPDTHCVAHEREASGSYECGATNYSRSESTDGSALYYHGRHDGRIDGDGTLPRGADLLLRGRGAAIGHARCLRDDNVFGNPAEI